MKKILFIRHIPKEECPAGTTGHHCGQTVEDFIIQSFQSFVIFLFLQIIFSILNQ